MIESKSPKQILMSDHIGNDLVCVITTHYFFLFCLYVICCAIMFIFFYVTRTILGLTFLHPDTTIETDFLFLFLFIRIWDTYYVRVGCCKGAMLTPGFFPFFSIVRWVKSKYRLFVPSFVSSYRSRCLGSRVSPSLVLCATDSSKGCPVFVCI